MSVRVDSSSWITGAIVVGAPGLGVKAELIPSSGENGAGYAYASLDFPADNGKEVCGRITAWPTNGSLTAYEDTSFEYVGASDSFSFQLYADGVSVGSPQTVSINIGTQPVAADLAGTYSVRASVQSDASGLFTIRGAVQVDTAASYLLRGSVSSDIGGTYDILNANSVSSSLAAIYIVLGAVQSDLGAAYELRNAVGANSESTFTVRGLVSSDLGASFDVQAALMPVYADLPGGYAIEGPTFGGGLSPADIAAIRSAVRTELSAELTAVIQIQTKVDAAL